jgi:hypothetical protein
MVQEKALKWTAAMSTLSAAAITASALLGRAKAAGAAPGEFPPEVLQLLSAMAAGMETEIAQLADILAEIRGMSQGGGQGIVPNADYAISGSWDFLAANEYFQLPDIYIPDDLEITVKAYPTNPVGSLLRVAKSAGECVDRYASYPLMPNESRGYRVKNANALYVSATVAPGCSVTWTVEQRR